MRELNLPEACYMAALLVLSLVLPLLMSFRTPKDAAIKSSCRKVVWTGQIVEALAGLTVIASARLAPYAAAFALATCVICVLVVLRKAEWAPVNLIELLSRRRGLIRFF